MVQSLPTMRETWVPSLGWEGPLKEGNDNTLQYSWLEKSKGWRSVVGYSPCGSKKSDTTEQLHCTSWLLRRNVYFPLFYWVVCFSGIELYAMLVYFVS